MYHQENTTFINYDEIDYESIYSRNSDYSFDQDFFNDNDSIFTRNDTYENDNQIDDIINFYFKKQETYNTVDLIDIQPIKEHTRDEKYFTLPLTQEQYYMLKQNWNKQMDDEIDRVKGARIINHLSFTDSDVSINSINSCPELSSSEMSEMPEMPSRFYDDEDENKNKKFKSWKKWFSKKSKNQKIKTNFYDSLVKN